MATIQIDSEKCEKDGICIATCPFLLFQEGDDGVPKLADWAEKSCLNCGHCIAICPGNAITVNGVAGEECEGINSERVVSKEQVSQLFKSRRSIRAYKDKTVEEETIAELLDIARWAPTAKNGQPVSWIVVNNDKHVYELAAYTVEWFRSQNVQPEVVGLFDAGVDIINRGAPVLLIAHAPKDAIKPEIDCAIAVATVEAAAPVFGLGGCWAGFFLGAAKVYQPILDFLDLPDGHEVYGALMLGYPKFKYKAIPPRAEARITLKR